MRLWGPQMSDLPNCTARADEGTDAIYNLADGILGMFAHSMSGVIDALVDYGYDTTTLHAMPYVPRPRPSSPLRPIGATVARQIPVLKVTCSNHVSVTAALSLGGPGGGLQFHSRFATERFDSVWAASDRSRVHHTGRPRCVRAVLGRLRRRRDARRGEGHDEAAPAFRRQEVRQVRL